MNPKVEAIRTLLRRLRFSRNGDGRPEIGTTAIGQYTDSLSAGKWLLARERSAA